MKKQYVLLYYRNGDPTWTQIAVYPGNNETVLFDSPEEAKQYAIDNLDYGCVAIQIVELLCEEI